MTAKTFRIPDATVSWISKGGRKYVDMRDLELWLRTSAASLDEQGAGEAPSATVKAIADCIKRAAAA